MISGVRTCSGRKPNPTTRAGNRLRYGNRRSSRSGKGSGVLPTGGDASSADVGTVVPMAFAFVLEPFMSAMRSFRLFRHFGNRTTSDHGRACTLKRLLSLATIGLLVVVGRSAVAAGAPAPDIWFGGIDPVIQNDRHADYQTDYMDLFKPDAPWPVTLAHTKVFRISTQLVLPISPRVKKVVPYGVINEFMKSPALS